jgi:alanine racemase
VNRRLLVDLEALAANYQLFVAASDSIRSADQSGLRNRSGPAAVGGVVKANAYGVGVAEAARRLLTEGCRHFFVATLEEAFALRDEFENDTTADDSPELFIFDGVDSSSAAEVARAGLIPVLNDETQLEAWRPHIDLPAAIHFDTGMHRLGFPSDTPADRFADLKITLVMTHLACADEPDSGLNAGQASTFAEIVRRFPRVPTSIGNSAGWLSGCQGDVGRPGIGLYGGNPFSDRPSPMRPVASLQGRILQLRALAPGETVGYGASWTAEQETLAATVAIGYADGVPRHLSGAGEMALEGGQRCPILGRVSMDTTVIDVSAAPGVSVGDWVECFGRHISVDEAADCAGTLSYELLTRVGARVPRVSGALG